MDLRRLHLLLELSRLGSMRAVAETHRLTTSTVSQQIAALAREVRTPLVEPEGRRVRLTPAGHRLADHAVTILAAVDAAQLDLDPDAEPAGRLRIGGFATAIRTAVLPDPRRARARPPAGGGPHPRVRARGGARTSVGRRPRPRPDLRLQPGARILGAEVHREAPVEHGVGPRGPVSGGAREWDCRPRLVGGAPMDRELTQQRGRGCREHLGIAGGLHAEDRPPDRQPRAGGGPDRRRPRGRAAPPRQAHLGRRTRAASRRADRRPQDVRRHATGSRDLAPAPAAARAPQPRIFSRRATASS